MDIHTLSASMVNQAAAAVGTQGAVPVPPANAEHADKTSQGDSVNISAEARAKAASSPAAAGTASSGAQSTADTLARRIAKLQKELQREQGADQTPEEKASHLSTLRGQITREHYVFGVQEARIVGYVGWALCREEIARVWLERNYAPAFDECQTGDCWVGLTYFAANRRATFALMGHIKQRYPATRSLACAATWTAVSASSRPARA